MAKQPWQKTKKQTVQSVAREQERKVRRQEEARRADEVDNKGKRYQRLTVMLLVMGVIAFLLIGSTVDIQAGSIMAMLSAVSFFLSGVFCVGFGRLVHGGERVYPIVGVVEMVLAVVVAVVKIV